MKAAITAFRKRLCKVGSAELNFQSTHPRRRPRPHARVLTPSAANTLLLHRCTIRTSPATSAPDACTTLDSTSIDSRAATALAPDAPTSAFPPPHSPQQLAHKPAAGNHVHPSVPELQQCESFAQRQQLCRILFRASPRRRPRLTPLCGQYTPEPPLSHHRSAQHPPRLRPARSRHSTRLLNSELRLLWLPPRRPRAPSRSPHSPPPHPPKPSAGSHARPSAPCPRPKFIGASLSNSISSLAANTGPHAGRARKHLSGIRRVNERAC